MKGVYGISPVIATVIIVAVAVAIAIAVVGWIMGIWGTFGATESIQVMPDSAIIVTDTTAWLSLHVKNTGSAAAVIYKIEIPGIQTFESFYTSTAEDATTSTIVVSPGKDATIFMKITASIIPGATYQVKVYTKAGNVYPATVQYVGG